jgi:hypothetical protein
LADIPVKIQAEGNLAAEAAKAAAGMSKIAAEEAKVASIAKLLGSDEKAVAAGIRQVESEEAKRAKAAKLHLAEQEKAEKKLHQQKIQDAKGETQLERAHASAFKREYGDIKGILKGDITPLIDKMGASMALPAAAASIMVTALLAGGAAAAALLGGITALALSAGVARDNTKAMLDVLTAGRGTETLSLLDGLAKQLGTSITDTRDKFIEFRKAGLDNKQSAALIKLKADLESTDLPAAEAEAGIKKIIDQAKKADGSFDGKIFDAAFKEIAKNASVAGDGVAAMAKNSKSLNGALASLDNSKTQALEAIYTSIKPKIAAAAQAVAQFVKGFLESDKGKAAIEGIGEAIGMVADAVPYLIDKAIVLYDAFSKFSDSTTGKLVLEGLKITLYAVGAALAVAAAGALLLIAPFVAAGVAVVAAGALIYNALKSLPDNIRFLAGQVSEIFGGLASSAVSFGSSIIQGLISGITNAASALYTKVSSIASGVKDAFKSVLGIASPSKEFEKLGVFTGKGLEIGLEKSTPDSADIAGNMLPSASQAQGVAGPSGGDSTQSSSVTIGDIVVNVANSDANPDDIARAIRRELSMLFSSMQLSQGLG